MIIVDASVAIKWVVPEDGTSEALALQSQELAAPAIWIVECANVLWRHVRVGEMSNVEAAEWLMRLRNANVSEISLDSLLSEAFILSNQIGHPVYDCLYLAAAIRHDTFVITADRRFASAVARQPALAHHLKMLSNA